jgi:fucose 4-O-acetylase-like acetyltransferase
MKERIQWLALLRGLNIILVVMGHVQLINISTGLNHMFCQQITEPFAPIRMPLFIFCYGGLLYLSRINKDWKVKKLYIDKIKRIVCPFLFFVTFYYVFKLLMNPLTKTKVVFSVRDFLESFYIYYQHPSAHLWFLSVLFWFMLLYPLFVWLSKSIISMILFLLFTIVIFFIDFTPLSPENYFFLFTLNKYLVFFFFGIFFFRYELYKYLENYKACLVVTILYIFSFLYEIPLVTSLLGILMMISICQQIALLIPTLFESFREYIYQIFLMSFIFQPFVELILWKKLFYNEDLFFLFYILNVFCGIFFPVLIAKAIERSNLKWLKICIGLK